jgi:flagellin
MERKEAIRAGLGATQNRLEGTVNNLTVKLDNLQMAESRISDVDLVKELTELTKNYMLLNTGTAMLAQAFLLGNMVNSLIKV